jgi:hypothetical protein
MLTDGGGLKKPGRQTQELVDATAATRDLPRLAFFHLPISIKSNTSFENFAELSKT